MYILNSKHLLLECKIATYVDTKWAISSLLDVFQARNSSVSSMKHYDKCKTLQRLKRSCFAHIPATPGSKRGISPLRLACKLNMGWFEFKII